MPCANLTPPAVERTSPARRPRPQTAAPLARCASLALVWALGFGGLSSAALAAEFVVTPPQVKFDRNFERAQLLVTAVDAAGQVSSRSIDLTPDAQYSVANPAVATVSATGNLQAVGNGQTTLTVTHEGVSRTVEVLVEGVVSHPS
ncbi:MAG: Ig-like domain-containing protein, partial [Planctomycetaceae bacterium]